MSHWLLLVLLPACENNGEEPKGLEEDVGDAPVASSDSDGDGILDAHEGTADDDGDGVPNNLDDDSDNDCISDAEERGDGSNMELPADTDSDGTPDYLDEDSDNNGLNDAQEAGDCEHPADADGDGSPNFADLDDDGDTLSDIEEGDLDSDGDGTADRLDTDADGDCVIDSVEAGDADLTTAAVDSDSDGLPNYLDDDSDEDGVSDHDEVEGECGSTSDIDADGIYDYVDDDTDGDGLADLDETDVGTDPKTRDTDGDGFTDGIEVYAGSNPLEEAFIPEGTVITMGPRSVVETSGTYTLDEVKADILLILDTSYSYSCYHPTLSLFVENVVNHLFSTFDDVAIGLGTFDDYPYGTNWASSTGHPYELRHQISTDATSIKNTSSSLNMVYGGDSYGSAWEAIHQSLSGVGFDQDCDGAFNSPNDVLPFQADDGDAFGGLVEGSYDASVAGSGDDLGVGFREGSTRVVMIATDNVIRDAEDGHSVPSGTCFDPADSKTVATELNDTKVKFLGVNFYEYQSSDSTLLSQLVEMAEATGSYIDYDGDGEKDDPGVIYGSWNLPNADVVAGALWDLAEEGISSRTLYVDLGEDPNNWVTAIGPDTEFSEMTQGDSLSYDVQITTSATLSRDDQFYKATVHIMEGGEVVDEHPIWLVIRPEQALAE